MCVTQMIRLWSNENGLQVCTRCAPKGQINPAQGNALGRIDIVFPRVPLRPWRRSTLGWVGLPLRGAPSILIYSWEHLPLPSITRGFAPGYRPPGLQPGLMVPGSGPRGRRMNV